MSKPQKPRTCIQIEPDLIAAATGEATGEADARVQSHVATCPPCRDDFTRYRAVDAVVGTLRGEMPAAADADAARARLIARLADLKSRLVSYKVFPSPLGPKMTEILPSGNSKSSPFRTGTPLNPLWTPSKRITAIRSPEIIPGSRRSGNNPIPRWPPRRRPPPASSTVPPLPRRRPSDNRAGS